MNKEQIVNIVRKPQVYGSIISIAIIALLSLIYFYPDVFDGNQLRQPDMLQGAANGHEIQQYEGVNGDSPRWTNSLFGGMPTFQIAPSYPSDGLFTWFNKVMGLWLPNPANLLVMMMLGFFILLMTMRLRWYVALIGAIAYGFSSYFIIIIGAGHIWKFLTLTYIPPTIAGIILTYRGKYLAGGAMTAFFAMMQISCNHIQMSYYFFFVIIGLVVACFFILLDNRLMQWAKSTGTLLIAGVLAVCANLPSLYNSYEYSKETMRGTHSLLTSENNNASKEGLDKDYITQYSYGGSENFALLIPNVKGGASLSMMEMDEAKELADKSGLNELETSYLGTISQYFGEPEGTSGPVYVGALIVALFLLGCVIVPGPFKWAMIALTVISILLAMGRNCMWLTDLMIDYMPMYNKFRTPESILVIAEFTMPLLGAMALQRLLTDQNAFEKYRIPIFASFGIVLFICLLGIIAPGIFGSFIVDGDLQREAYYHAQWKAQGAPDAYIEMMSLSNPKIYSVVEEVRMGMVRSDAFRSFMVVASAGVFLMLYFKRLYNGAVATFAIGLIIVIDLLGVNKRYLNSESFIAKEDVPTQSFSKGLADDIILEDTTMNYRVLNIPEFSKADPSYWHKSIGGYHAAKLTRYQDLIDRHLSHFTTGKYDEADMNVLNMLNTKYIIVDNDGQPITNGQALGNAWFVDEVAYVKDADEEMLGLSVIQPAYQAVAHQEFKGVLGTPATVSPGDTIYETSYAPDRLTYHADTKNGGVAVFSEIYFPWGWHATIDGQPVDIARVNYVLRAIKVPAGNHTIEMVFDPQSLHTTGAIAYISIILIYLSIALAIVLSSGYNPFAKKMVKADEKSD